MEFVDQVEVHRPSGVQLLQRDGDQAVSADIISARRHGVIANDLFDKDLKVMSESLWESRSACRLPKKDSNRRVTTALELVIQASGVSHTMEHFTVYKKWNRRFYAEIDEAYHMHHRLVRGQPLVL